MYHDLSQVCNLKEMLAIPMFVDGWPFRASAEIASQCENYWTIEGISIFLLILPSIERSGRWLLCKYHKGKSIHNLQYNMWTTKVNQYAFLGYCVSYIDQNF